MYETDIQWISTYFNGKQNEKSSPQFIKQFCNIVEFKIMKQIYKTNNFDTNSCHSILELIIYQYHNKISSEYKTILSKNKR